MKKYLIEDAKCGVAEGGISCGPVSGSVNAAIKFKESNKTQWLSLSEYDGIPAFYLTDDDIFDSLVEEDYNNEKLWDYIKDHEVSEFDGLTLGEYEDVLDSIKEDSQNPAVPVIRYLISLVRCEKDEENKLISMAIGKYADELEIPTIDIEEDYE